MKSIALVFFISLACFSPAIAQNLKVPSISNMEEAQIIHNGKIYIHPTQIHSSAEGLFVDLDGSLYQVSEICQDPNGYYIPTAGFWWTCRNGHPNPPWRLICWVCGQGPY